MSCIHFCRARTLEWIANFKSCAIFAPKPKMRITRKLKGGKAELQSFEEEEKKLGSFRENNRISISRLRVPPLPSSKRRNASDDAAMMEVVKMRPTSSAIFIIFPCSR